MKNTFLYKSLFLLLVGWGVSTTLSAQITGPQACVEFEYLCGGADAPFPDAQISTNCFDNIQTWNIVDDGDSFCWIDAGGCEDPDRSGCLLYKNWHFCPSGSGVVFQTLPRNASINGMILGDYPLEAPVNNLEAPCIGLIYQDFNNSLASVTSIERCQGDPMMLKVPALELPAQYDGRLLVRINELANNSTAAFAYYTAASINAEDEIDISSLFESLAPDLYVFELRLSCNGPPGGCATDLPNRVKKTIIDVRGDLFIADYNYTLLAPFGTNCNMPTNYFYSVPDGVVIPYEYGCNSSIRFQLDNIEYTGDQGIGVELLSRTCGTSDQWSSITNASFSADAVASGNVILGSYSPEETPQCICYRLDVTYLEDCVGEEGTVSRYFRIGESCSGGTTSAINTSPLSSEFQLSPNPFSDFVVINWNKNINASFQLAIYNSSGQIVEEREAISAGATSWRIDVNQKPGIYFYKITWEQGSQTGTLIKQ